MNFGSIGSDKSGNEPRRAEVGVLTATGPETQAVTAVLRQMCGYQQRDHPSAFEAWLPDRRGRRVRVAAMPDYRCLIEEYRPATVLLVGVAGGVGRRVRIGDVVIGKRVIEHDYRQETAAGTLRRGQAREISADLTNRLAEFTRTVPDEQLRPADGSFRIHCGPIGSGNAVVTDANAEIRRWLYEFHERVLAVETGAARAAHAFHENLRHDSTRGWLTIRGIADTADEPKGGHETTAANHAAEVMAMLLPYLYFATPG
ncbi:hypothetical protein [Actinoplanes sp. NPDC026619]|uniref:5'-methylthioadenosine/S-adenosylhomocysteine nucleosidase family protein n=1 Tax=Actinoplanes sp. NPDC026619 TaxID=3155798 RepID=UPI0033E69767